MSSINSELEERVADLEERVSELEEMVSGAQVMPSESDLESFIKQVDPGTHVERATAIGYYLTHEESDSAPFSVSDIEEGYMACRIQKPANLSDVLSGAEERGWLVRAGKRGQHQLWQISHMGDEAVMQGFQ